MDTTCVIDQRPVEDPSAYACIACGRKLAGHLADVVRYAADAQDAADGFARYGSSNGGGSGEDRAPGNLSAAAIVAGVTNDVVTWLRHVEETRGLNLDGPRALSGPRCATDCRHRSCSMLRAGTREHSASYAARILAAPTHLHWLRHRPELTDAYADLEAAARQLARVADRPPDLVLVGTCRCESWIYARQADAWARCRGCGTRYNVEDNRDILRAAMDQQLLTAAQIAILAARAGHNRGKVRHLVTIWGGRGVIVTHPTDNGPRYRLGEVLGRLGEPDLERAG